MIYLLILAIITRGRSLVRDDQELTMETEVYQTQV